MTSAPPRVEVVADIAAFASEFVAGRIDEAVNIRGRAVLCLSGGSTPLPVYRRLAAMKDLPWAQVYFAWGDERWIPHSDPASNVGNAREALLDHLPVSAEHVLAWPYGEDPALAARAYASSLAEKLTPTDPDQPWFDLVLLGLGDDGHTASLFPGTGAALRNEVAFAVLAPSKGWRLTLSAQTLSNSRTVAFLVAGDEKGEALRSTWPSLFGDQTDPAPTTGVTLDDYPARAIGAADDLVIVTDQHP